MGKEKLPVLFVSHGSPMLMVDKADGADYRVWGEKLGKPKALLVFSAHWESEDISYGETTSHADLIYDFWGFPEELYDIQYAAPGAPWLMDEIDELLGDKFERTGRGMDHGVYVPFIHMWPEADVPILQVSLPRSFDDQQLFELGKRLAPLREKGVLIIGAGALTHNLRAFNPHYQGGPVEWAKAFDDWLENVLLNNDVASLVDWQRLAPNAQMNHPTPEHFRPLLITVGAGVGDSISFPTTGFSFGSFSRRSVQYG